MKLIQRSRADTLNGSKLTGDRIIYFLGTAE